MTLTPTPTDLQVRVVMWMAAVHSAEQLGLTRKFRLDNLWDGQLVLIATPQGMNIGYVMVTQTEDGTMRHEQYHLNEQLLCERSYDTADDVWKATPELVSHLPEQVAIFVENALG